MDESIISVAIDKIAEAVNDNIINEINSIIYTKNGQAEAISALYPRYIISLVREIHLQPKFILAKGDATASDVLSKGIDVKNPVLLGQVIAGVSAWRADEESRYPGMPYLVFPEEVADENLVKLLENLTK